ncbi:MAG: hypothetical protein KGP12_10805 [Actinomycetales bacterium]|nr:hypothetical protein [Actinomycetales bacterium]
MAASAGFQSPDPVPSTSPIGDTTPSAAGDQTEDNAFLPIAIGTLGWLVAGAVLLMLGSRLSADSRWWIGSCAVGVISGVGGMIYVKRRAGRPRRAAARRARSEGQA